MGEHLRDQDLPKTLDDHICFAVYAASHAFSRAYRPMLRELGLTYPQYLVLTALWEKDVQTVGALGAALGLETNTLTPLLKRVEALGFVQRRRGDQDERQVFLHLTSEGKGLRDKAPDVTRCIVEATGMDLPALKALVKDMETLRRSVEKATAARDA